MIKYILLLLLTLTSCGPFSPFIQKPSNPLNPFDPLRHKPKSTLEQGLEKMNEMMELVKKYEQEFIIHFNELKEKVNANDLVHSINSQFTSIKNTIDKNNINQLNQLGIPQHAVENSKLRCSLKLHQFILFLLSFSLIEHLQLKELDFW